MDAAGWKIEYVSWFQGETKCSVQETPDFADGALSNTSTRWDDFMLQWLIVQ